MAAVAGSLFNLHQDRIQEVINRNVEVYLVGLDPIWRDTLVTSQGVGPADAIGRDMRILKVFHGAFAGVVEQASPRNDFVLYGDDTDTIAEKIHKQNLVQTFPDPRDGANASPYRWAVDMDAMVSNLMLTLGEMQAEATPAFLGQVIAPKLSGHARYISHTLSTAAYLNDNDSYQLCAISSIGAKTGAGPYTYTFETDNMAIDRFWQGQRVDIYESTGTTRQNLVAGSRSSCWVARVDELSNKVTIAATADPATWTGGEPVNGDIIVHAESKGTSFTNFHGIRAYLKGGSGGNDDDLLGGRAIAGDTVDVTLHPEHKSFTKDLGGAVLTEHLLRQYLRRWHAAKRRYGMSIDCLIASDGVWMAYEATKIGREHIDRTNRLSSLKAEGSQTDKNFGGFSFTIDGMTYTGFTSTYVEKGTVYGLKKGGGNFKRYVPPSPQGTKSFSQLESFIPFEFVGPALTGLPSLQVPITATSSGDSGAIGLLTEGVQLPGMLRMQLVPDQPAGMILSNVAEDRIYSDN